MALPQSSGSFALCVEDGGAEDLEPGKASRRPRGLEYGRNITMTTTMDAAGRLVIPRDIRREAALEPGTPLEVRWRDGIIEIEPQPANVTLVRKGRLLVARPEAKLPLLRTATVERTRRTVTSGRNQS